MDILAQLALGFQAALTPEALFYCFIGVTIGTLVGVLPGIGPLAAISLALPVTFYLDPTLALIMLAGIFYGAQYGGSTAAILLNIAGDASAAVTCLDGYPLSRQGRAGVALFVTTVASFVGGSIAIIALIALAPILARLALQFGPAEYFSIMLLGLIAASTLSVGSPLKGLTMVVAGSVLGLVGMDVNSGQLRFTYGFLQLIDGVDLAVIAMGLFGLSEILGNVGRDRSNDQPIGHVSLRSMIPTREDVRISWRPALRGSVLGTAMGTLPGIGPTIASFMSYALEKRVSKTPARFGTGALEGVAAPEAANNASVQAAFIPTLSLGIPGNAVMAVLLGAMMIHGVVPGPGFLNEQPEMFWGLVASFWIGNLMLLILNIPLIGVWVRILAIPYRVLYILIVFFICVGVFSLRGSSFDIFLVLIFGVAGYLLTLFRYPLAPLLLGFILGPMIEQYFKRAMLIARGDVTVFATRPLSAVFLAIALGLLVVTVIAYLRNRNTAILRAEEA